MTGRIPFRITGTSQNLRATRSTEVDDEYGSKAEASWIGHGERVAMKSYRILKDDLYLKAAGVQESALDSNLSKTP